MKFTTSGTTGIPKTFTMSDDLFAARVRERAASRIEVFADCWSLFSDLSLKTTAGATNKAWAEQYGIRFFNDGGGSLESALALFEREDIDAITANPLGLLNYARANGPHRFKSIQATGAPLTANHIAALRIGLGTNIFSTYGASEVGTIAIATATDIETVPGCVGRLCPGVSVDCTDGIVRVRTTTMIDGYDDPALTARFFVNGWFLPGDRGYVADGELLVLTGRAR